MFNPIKFFREVKQEALKIKWANWQDTKTTTMVVLVMIVLCAAMFWLVDTGIQFLVNLILT